MLEWLTHGLRQLNIEPSLERKVIIDELSLHKLVLPSDLKYLTQVAYYIGQDTCCADTDEEYPMPDAQLISSGASIS